MLFNSQIFIFLFLPFVFFGFYFLGRNFNREYAFAFLVVASLFFYGWWNPVYVVLIVASILVNYLLGVRISNCSQSANKRLLLILGLALNLSLLGYYKYANFFVDSLNVIGSYDFHMAEIALPLAISFFTFQQVAYLVDAYRGEAKEYNFLHYCLFISFFPQLIAGPIVHHKEILPQFQKRSSIELNMRNVATGLTIFFMGLFKKVVIADGIAAYSTPVFGAAAGGHLISFYDAWIGALGYTFQIYFDFSGYSDMAIGIAYLFNIKLPLNFHSPYKAVNIIDFWRRWHMTLSRFLRDYLYFPLGGNRKGSVRRYMNLMTTMLLGGLWHGAGFTFIIWGAMHGAYLIVNHAWAVIKKRLGLHERKSTVFSRALARVVTLFAVVIAWVVFRAEGLDATINMLKGMAGLHGITDASTYTVQFGWIATLFIVVWSMPNTQEIIGRKDPIMDALSSYSLKSMTWLRWRPAYSYALATGFIALIALVNMSKESEFLYFQF